MLLSPQFSGFFFFFFFFLGLIIIIIIIIIIITTATDSATAAAAAADSGNNDDNPNNSYQDFSLIQERSCSFYLSLSTLEWIYFGGDNDVEKCCLF